MHDDDDGGLIYLLSLNLNAHAHGFCLGGLMARTSSFIFFPNNAPASFYLLFSFLTNVEFEHRVHGLATAPRVPVYGLFDEAAGRRTGRTPWWAS